VTQVQTDRLALIAKRSKRTIEDVTERWHERAAIRQYDGGATRRDAERDALNDVADVVLR
jgi:hypothetical protein